VIAYKPLESQRRFHRLATRFKGFSGPIGSGKSAALCQEAIRLAYQNPGCMGLLGAPTYPMMRDATQRAMVELLERNDLPYALHKSESYLELSQCQGKILMRSLDDFERLRGTNLAWFGVDELTYCKEEAWLRLEGRLREPRSRRMCGFAVWTPKGMDWVHRRFVQNDSGEYGVVLAQPWENRHILQVDPNFYERLKNTYSDAFYRQEVLGEYLENDGNRVYASFKRELNVRSLERDVFSPLLWTLDFNVDPFCSLVCQRSGDVLHVLDEIILQRKTSTVMASEMNDRYGQRAHALAIFGDASGRSAQTNGPNNYQQLLDELGTEKWNGVELRVPRRNPPVLERLHLVNRMLCSAAEEVRVLIDPKCRSLIADLEQVQFRSDGVTVDKHGDSKRTHSADALGYLLWEEFGPHPTIGEANKPADGLVLG
jgi:hypothetical protein